MMDTTEQFSTEGAFFRESLVAVFDAKGNLLSAAQQLREDLDRAHVPAPQNPFEAIDPESRERITSVLRKTIESGHGQRSEHHVIQKDGSERFVEVQSDILLDAQGRHSNILVILRDVSGWRSAMTGVRSMVEASGGWLWAVDANGVYSYASPKVKELLGYDPAELIGRKVSEFAPRGEADRLSEALASLLAKRKPIVNLETRKVHKNGTVIVMDTYAVPLLDGTGRLHGYQGVDRDIVGRKQVEEQLRKLTRVVEQSPAAIVITNMKGDIEYVNPKFCEMTGYRREEVIGRNPRILKSGEMPPEGYKRMWETISSGREWRGEFHNRRKDGELYWEFASISPIKDADSKITHYLAVKEDVTDRKRIDEERLKLVVELQQALAKVNTLSGLLPICAWCKKVRDDEGYWKQIENYVEAHSNAEFTHGICPDCAQKMHSAQPKARRKVTT